jgi:hypothetical protein
MDKELIEIRARMEELAFRMQQDAKSRWVYEWPMKMKVKWPVKELLAKGSEVVEGMAEVCGRPQGLKKKWFMCVNQKLGEISVMMRRRDHWKISETARRAERKFNFQVGNEMRSLLKIS